MKKLRFQLAAVAFVASLLFVSTASAQTQTYNAAGSSAMFNAFAIAAGTTMGGTAPTPLCGTHHWTQKSGNVVVSGAKQNIGLVDPRNSNIPEETGNIWIVWNDDAVATPKGSNPRVCYYLSVDSTVGVRAYAASAAVSIASAYSGSADQNIVPLLGVGESLNPIIFAAVNNSVINTGMTDIRAEDAKFATIRAQYGYGVQIPNSSVTGVGYGPQGIGTPIMSSQSSTKATPIEFSITGYENPDFFNAPFRPYLELNVGADPVMIIANTAGVGAGHFSDTNINNVSRWTLRKLLSGEYVHIRQLATSGASGMGDFAPHVFIREPLSGTYNTMEWAIPNSREMYTFIPGQASGQEAGINPSNTACTTTPCTVESGNPLWHIAANGATRGRAIGTGEMVTAVNGTTDGVGYAFWGFSNFQGKTHLKYLTVDGVDPLYLGPNDNPGGVGVLPQCATVSGVVSSCPHLAFPNIANGAYPIWSKLRAIWDANPNNLAPTVVNYAQYAADPVTGQVADFLPIVNLGVFRSHDPEIIIFNGGAIGPNNGILPTLGYNTPETGRDMGGAILTIQSEVDETNDVPVAQKNAAQQVSLEQ